MRIFATGLSLLVLALLLIYGSSSTSAQQSSYAEDRALIEDLQARYMFALDNGDIDAYLTTFTKDGALDIGDGPIKGYDEIRKVLSGMPNRKPEAEKAEPPKLRRATGRHNITNIVLKIDGNRAVGRAYWFHYGNNNPQRTPTLDSYGHYEDEMIKMNGNWYFTKRMIYNEQVEKWASRPGNPAW
jgi:hypothetical protein